MNGELFRCKTLHKRIHRWKKLIISISLKNLREIYFKNYAKSSVHLRNSSQQNSLNFNTSEFLVNIDIPHVHCRLLESLAMSRSLLQLEEAGRLLHAKFDTSA